MKSAAAIRFLLVVALAAWTTLCCCERRALADAIFGSPASGATSSTTPEGCESRCCGDCSSADRMDETDEPADAPHERGCCDDGCCLKATTPPTHLELVADPVGREIPSDGWTLAPQARETARAAPFGDDEVRPPPWRILVVSARLRI